MRPGGGRSPLQALEPLGFHLLGDLLRHLGGRRARPRRIFERERAGVADLLDQRERRVEILLALARKADDEVGGERHVRPRGAHARDGVEIVGAACGGGSWRRGCGRSPTAPEGADRASGAAGRDAPRSGSRPCRRDGWWCSAAARCPAPRQRDAAVARASMPGRPVLRRDRR